MNQTKSTLKPRWWKKVKNAYEGLKEETNNFTTNENIDTEEVEVNRYKLIALRLISGWDREQTALYVGSPPQSLARSEDGKTRTVLSPERAEKMVLRSDFQDFRKHGPTNPFITRFFVECSLRDLIRDHRAKRWSDLAFWVAVTPLLFSLMLMLFVTALGVVVAYAFLGSLILFFCIVVATGIVSRTNPLIGASIEEQLVYASRLLLAKDRTLQRLSVKLLNGAAKLIKFRARAQTELEDVKELYEEIATSLRKRLIPHATKFDALNERQKSTSILFTRRLAEHYFSPTLDSAISIRELHSRLKRILPESPARIRRKGIARVARRLRRTYETQIGRLIVDATLFMFIAFVISSTFWVVAQAELQTTAIVFAAVLGALIGLRAIHVSSR